MKSFLTFAMACLLAAAPALRAQSLTPEDRYFDIYSLIVKGDRQTEKGRPDAARTNYVEAATELKKLQEDYPLWNKNVVKYRLNYLDEKLSTPETPAATNTGKPVEMKLKWEVGKRYEQQMDMTMDMGVNSPDQAQGQGMQTKMKIGEGFAISAVKNRDEGGKELDLRITGVTMSMDMGGSTLMSYDSKNPPSDAGSNPAMAMLQKLGDLHLTMLTDAKGSVESVEGFKDFLDSLGDSGGGAQPLKGFFTEDSLKQMVSLEGLPDHPVKVGDSWPIKKEISVPSMGTMVQDLTCTFTGWEQRENHKCAVIAVSGTISTKPGDDASAAPMMTIEDGKLTGEIYFDPALGMPIESSINQGFSVKVNASGQSMSTRVAQDISTKLAAVTDIPQAQ
jgi:Family of unknown function (DUF6263)